MINNKLYQQIFDELSEYLVNGWDKLVVYLEFGNASYSFSFYEKIDGDYIKCFDIPSVDEKDLDISFKNIDMIVSPERDKLEDKWSNMTMVVESNGSMHTYFDYTNLSDGNYNYIKEWKKRYLI